MLELFDNIVTWIDSCFSSLQEATTNVVNDVDTLLDNMVKLQDQVSQMIEVAKYYIIGSGIVLFIILIFEFVLLSKIKAQKQELAEIKALLQPEIALPVNCEEPAENTEL